MKYTWILALFLVGCSHDAALVKPYHVKSFENGVLVVEREGVVFTAKSAGDDGVSLGFLIVGEDLPSLYDCRMHVKDRSLCMDQAGDSLFVTHIFQDGSSSSERFEILKISEARR